MEYGTAVIIGELGSLELAAPTPAAAGIYDQPIGLRLLFDVRPADEPHD